MERKNKPGTWAVFWRFVRRRWRTPARVLKITAGAVAFTGMLYLVPARYPRQTPATRTEIAAEGAGTVASLRRKGVGTGFDGAVASVYVRVGQAVRKGEVLFRMETAEARAGLAQARADEAAARKELSQVLQARKADLLPFEAEVAAARAQLKRAPLAEERALHEADGEFRLVSAAPHRTETSLLEARLRETLQQLGERREAWEPSLSLPREAIKAAHGEMRRWKNILTGAERRSPFSGVVTAVFIKPGDYVASHRPLVRIDDPAGYRVVTLVDQTTRAGITPGTRLQLAAPNGSASGRVEKIVGGQGRELFRYYVWVKPGRPSELTPGQGVTVRIAPPPALASN